MENNVSIKTIKKVKVLRSHKIHVEFLKFLNEKIIKRLISIFNRIYESAKLNLSRCSNKTESLIIWRVKYSQFYESSPEIIT